MAPLTSPAQTNPPAHKKQTPDITDSLTLHYPTLKRQFGTNKIIPPKYEKQILYALSYYPELANTKIEFQVKKSKSGIISTRPFASGLLRRSSRRGYLVVIYDSIEGRTLPTFANADVNGQVGILGHELCHIVYFNNKSGLGLVGLGAAHVSSSYMDRFEYNTDSMNIVRGLGYQLMAWKQYLDKKFAAMRPRDAKLPDKINARQRYMTVEQIRRVMKKTEEQ